MSSAAIAEAGRSLSVAKSPVGVNCQIWSDLLCFGSAMRIAVQTSDVSGNCLIGQQAHSGLRIAHENGPST